VADAGAAAAEAASHAVQHAAACWVQLCEGASGPAEWHMCISMSICRCSLTSSVCTFLSLKHSRLLRRFGTLFCTSFETKDKPQPIIQFRRNFPLHQRW